MPEMERLKLAIDHAQVMHKALCLPKNAAKGSWTGMDISELRILLDRELEEFHAAIWAFTFHGGSAQRVEEEGADISNFVAMIVDNCKRQEANSESMP